MPLWLEILLQFDPEIFSETYVTLKVCKKFKVYLWKLILHRWIKKWTLKLRLLIFLQFIKSIYFVNTCVERNWWQKCSWWCYSIWTSVPLVFRSLKYKSFLRYFSLINTSEISCPKEKYFPLLNFYVQCLI